MLRLSLLVAAIVLCSFALGSRDLFLQFKKDYNREYANKAEEMYRYAIFMRNMKKAEKLNTAPGNRAIYGVTQFMDLTPEEFRSTYLTLDTPKFDKNIPFYQPKQPIDLIDYPDYFNWVDLNATTPVYDQGQCGSCWAFSATETIESFWYLANNPLTQLSMQQINSCDRTSFGCDGGNPVRAYRYVMRAGGIETYENYPYTSGNGQTGECQFNSDDVYAKISGFSYVTTSPASNETLMQEVTYTTGPLSVCVDAVTWQFYRGGIVTQNCGQNLDHAVQLTGFATSSGSSPVQYWIVRNSWGPAWGEEGYIWIEMFKDLCGIADQVTIVSI